MLLKRLLMLNCQVIVLKQSIVVQFLALTNGPRTHSQDFERGCYESLLIVLDTLESCLSNQPKDNTRFDETMNVKLLLREICQFLGESYYWNYKQNIGKLILRESSCSIISNTALLALRVGFKHQKGRIVNGCQQ